MICGKLTLCKCVFPASWNYACIEEVGMEYQQMFIAKIPVYGKTAI